MNWKTWKRRGISQSGDKEGDNIQVGDTCWWFPVITIWDVYASY